MYPQRLKHIDSDSLIVGPQTMEETIITQKRTRSPLLAKQSLQPLKFRDIIHLRWKISQVNHNRLRTNQATQLSKSNQQQSKLITYFPPYQSLSGRPSIGELLLRILLYLHLHLNNQHFMSQGSIECHLAPECRCECMPAS